MVKWCGPYEEGIEMKWKQKRLLTVKKEPLYAFPTTEPTTQSTANKFCFFFKYVINHSRISKGFKFTQDANSVT